LDSTTGDYIKIRELLLQVPKDEVLFWSSSSHQIITDDVA
jgi:hypothetical protein